uniref:hypothetical protein n=1 Tax=Vibrio fluvialis TaxID=676 RepID=UPI001EEC5F2F
GGRGFESRPLRHLFKTSAAMLGFFAIWELLNLYTLHLTERFALLFLFMPQRFVARKRYS